MNDSEVRLPYQTSQRKKHEPFVEIARDKLTKDWHWVIWSANGRKVATNDIPLATPKDCRKAIEQLIEIVPKLKAIYMAEEDGNATDESTVGETEQEGKELVTPTE